MLHEDFVSLIEVHWIDEAIHAVGVAALLTANRRSLSSVDCISLVFIQQMGMDEVFRMINTSRSAGLLLFFD